MNKPQLILKNGCWRFEPGLKVDGEARIVHSDRQDCYDGDLPNRLSRITFVGKNDNHNQIRNQSNRNCLSDAVIQLCRIIWA